MTTIPTELQSKIFRFLRAERSNNESLTPAKALKLLGPE